MVKKIVVSPENNEKAIRFFNELSKKKEEIRNKIASKNLASRFKLDLKVEK